MKNNNKVIMCAAISGILMGASVAHAIHPNPEMGKCGDVNECKGAGGCGGDVNACKGTGGCGAGMMCKDQNSCKGENECKAVKEAKEDQADDEATVDEE